MFITVPGNEKKTKKESGFFVSGTLKNKALKAVLAIGVLYFILAFLLTSLYPKLSELKSRLPCPPGSTPENCQSINPGRVFFVKDNCFVSSLWPLNPALIKPKKIAVYLDDLTEEKEWIISSDTDEVIVKGHRIKKINEKMIIDNKKEFGKGGVWIGENTFFTWNPWWIGEGEKIHLVNQGIVSCGKSLSGKTFDYGPTFVVEGITYRFRSKTMGTFLFIFFAGTLLFVYRETK